MFALLVVAGVFTAAAAVDALWPAGQALAEEPEVVFGAVQEARDRARLRCESCGVVAAIRHIEAAEGVAASYEVTVRLADGTLRLTNDPFLGQWRVGDRIRLIGGAAPAP